MAHNRATPWTAIGKCCELLLRFRGEFSDRTYGLIPTLRNFLLRLTYGGGNFGDALIGNRCHALARLSDHGL